MSVLIFAFLALFLRLTSAQASSVITFFLPGSEPISLDASVISVGSDSPTAPGRITPQVVTHIQLACPTARLPDNDACRAASVYPAQVYHTQGSVWGGTTIHAAATTTWECALMDTPGETPILSANCKRQVVSGTMTGKEEVFGLGNCYVLAHRLPIVVTAGQEKIPSDQYMNAGVDQINSWDEELLSSANCPTTTRSIWEHAAETTATTTQTVTHADSEKTLHITLPQVDSWRH
ncbi:hypothetical protein QBC38DRAFT_525144 [Podospora fimiseda]|uniref:Ecp2 effector protein domain-containing protein n=1 Tax=Podospora fimiseda TaxID=252190 RepID=A0AAN7BCI2_9PEZI|nr:hypothetical protein QBC38DRAFT_525144 [Podospora fimiseda]